MRVTCSEEKAGHIGSEKCMTCHDDHGKEFSKKFSWKTFVKEKQLNQAEHCETCHGAGSLHAEAAGDKKCGWLCHYSGDQRDKSKRISKFLFAMSWQQLILIGGGAQIRVKV